jgi:drug/metabolite transporter (DMT)-like permease
MWRAILFMLIGMMLIPTGDAASKLLSNTHGYHPFFITWARFAVGSLLVLPFIPRRCFKVFRNPVAWGRGLLLAVGISVITFAVALEDLADVFAVFFIGPIISYILAAIFLKETITLERSALLVIGFTGILLIARPGFGFSIGLACALFAGCSYGVFLTLSRLAAGQEEPKALLFSQSLIASGLCTPMALIYWPEHLFASPAMLTVSGAASMLGNMFLILAYGRAPATRMAPFVYFQLVGALLLGWGVFGTLPDVWGLAGLALLMISGFGSAFLRR